MRMQRGIELAPNDLHAKTETLAIVEALLKGIEYPKGELSEGYEYLTVPPELRPRLESIRIDLIARIKAQDPTFVAKVVKPVKGPGCGSYLVVLVVALIIAAVVLHFLIKFSKGDF
jgi:hypothetical protein